MKMKKSLCIVLALVFAIGMLAGCGGTLEDTSADISAFVDNEEKLEISWYGYYVNAGCTEGTAPELLMEEKFNVDIKPIFTEGQKYVDKKNALMQAGDIPDMIYQLDPAHLFADARDEFLFEVPYAAIKKFAPSLYQQLNDSAPAVWAYAYYDGANYGLPNINHSHMESRTHLYRKDWLDKLDLEVPETLDELHDVLYAFVHNDPDGNGKDDTYGYALQENHRVYYFTEIFGAYGLLPFDWQEVDGEIVYGGLREENEEVLSVLAKWYEEGLIYPGFIAVDQSSDKLFKSGLVGFNHFYAYEDKSLTTSAYQMLKEKTPEAELVYSHSIKGPDGLSGSRSWGYPCHVVSFGANGEETPIKVTRMLKMFETIYNDDALLTELRYGKENVTYTFDKNGDGKSALKPTADYAESSQRRLAGYYFDYAGPGFWTPFAPKAETYKNSLTNGYNKFKEEYQSEDECLVDVFYKVDIVPSAPTYIEDLTNQQRALMSEIITGKKAADQYIEEFTKIWEATGGPTMLDEARAQKGILDEIYAKIGIEQ